MRRVQSTAFGLPRLLNPEFGYLRRFLPPPSHQPYAWLTPTTNRHHLPRPAQPQFYGTESLSYYHESWYFFHRYQIIKRKWSLELDMITRNGLYSIWARTRQAASNWRARTIRTQPADIRAYPVARDDYSKILGARASGISTLNRKGSLKSEGDHDFANVKNAVKEPDSAGSFSRTRPIPNEW